MEKQNNNPESHWRVHLWFAVTAYVFGIALIVGGFLVPPMGVIDPSVLIVAGEMLTFVATLLGLTLTWRRQP